MSRIKEISILILIFLLPMLVYLAGFRYIPCGDTIPAELLPISIIHEKDLDLDEFINDLDFDEFPTAGDGLPYFFKAVKGRIVSMYSVIPGILNLPVFTIAYILGVDLMEKRFLLSLLSSSFIVSLSVLFMYLTLLKICRRKRTAVFFALIYAFATCVWSVAAKSMWQHGPSLLFIVLSLYCLFSERDLIPFSGLFLGMAVFNRPATLLMVALMAFYVFFYHRDKFKKFAIFFLGPIVFLFWYSYVYWGSFIRLGQGHGLFFSDSFWEGLAGILVSPARGLFIFSPVFIFSFFYLFYVFFRDRSEAIYKYLSICVISWLLLVAAWPMWWGGHCFGYRLLIEIIPMLVIFLALFWQRFAPGRAYLKVIFLFFLSLSVYTQFLGAFCYPSGFNMLPDRIAYSKKRLWKIRDTEIIRCSRNFFKDLVLMNKK